VIYEVKLVHIWSAYRLLKTYTYYENLNLYLKSRLANFETAHIHSYPRRTITKEDLLETPIEDIGTVPEGYDFQDFKKEIEEIKDHPFSQLIDVLNSNDPLSHPSFNKWLEDIGFRLIPKHIASSYKANNGSPLFLTNKKTSDTYNIDKVNYFIDAPIEIHIIEIMWTVLAGRSLDNSLTNGCFGNRLSDHALVFREKFYGLDEVEKTQGELFYRYVEQYGKWRDGALNAAKAAVENDSNAAIFSLDLKSYFYNIEIDFQTIQDTIAATEFNPEIRNFELLLSSLLEAVHISYRETIDDFLGITHNEEFTNKGLPIGFASSSMLANWHLNNLDTFITQTIRPVFYGRYVDDLIFVFKDPVIDDDPNASVHKFVKSYFNNVLEKAVKANEYKLTDSYHGLPIQGDKLILHYFDKEHTLAGLEVFQKELEERSSAFRFLPDDHFKTDLEKFSYNVLYDGSANKFRSVVGLAENESELSQYLSSHIIAHRLCKIKPEHNPVPKLKSFFKGENAIRYSRLWEKVFSYAVIKGSNEHAQFARDFHEDIQKLIQKTRFLSAGIDGATELLEGITQKVRKDLFDYLGISCCLPLALLSDDKASGFVLKKDDPYWIFEYSGLVKNIRKANIFRHTYVTWPLLNYTNHSESLCDPDFFMSDKEVSLSNLKIGLSPRFIHFEEWQVLNSFQRIQMLDQDNPFINFTQDTVGSYKDNWFQSEFPIDVSDTERSAGGINFNRITISADDKEEHLKKNLKVAIANLQVSAKDIEKSYRRDKSANVDFERQRNLWEVLNEAERLKVKLLVLPEVSIPVSWLPFMVAHARRHQIGLIFGLEHWVVGDIAYNLIVEAFPFQVSGKYNSCLVSMRVKNHYAPEEKDVLREVRIKTAEPNSDSCLYNLIKWNGIQLASYNCFELANIEHRSLFRSELDLLVACVWNKDTSYYDHILQSATRDLFCFVMQSNTSQYGGSCVLKPSRSIESQIIKVKGGDNGCILTTTLDILGIRDAQHKSEKGRGGNSYKVTPPGYKHDEVLKR
jgi:hypothetical protein